MPETNMAGPRPGQNPSGVRQSEEETMRMAFEKKVGHRNQRNRHVKTSVLQLSWQREHSDLEVDDEIEDLRKVFVNDYDFKVGQASLDPDKPQQQALMTLSRFVFDEDEAGALLIIYYAGHGYGGDAVSGDIKLVGKKLGNKEAEAIVWSKVELAIQETQADVLLIFDCCDAGRLARPLVRSAQPTSSFQFLGACSEDQFTKRPGKESFTAALIWALRALAQSDRPFNTPELRAKIMFHEHFPKEQVPVLSDRRGPYEHIMISKHGLAHPPTTPVPTANDRELWEHFDLRFHFEHPIALHHVERAADALNHLQVSYMHREGGPLWSRIGFLTKSSVVRDVAKVWRERTRDKSISKERPPVTPTGLLIDSEAALNTSAMGFTLSPQVTRLPIRASPSDCSPDPFGPMGETQALINYNSFAIRRLQADSETIPFHLRAIARRFRILLSQAFSYIANRLIPRSRTKDILDEA